MGGPSAGCDPTASNLAGVVVQEPWKWSRHWQNPMSQMYGSIIMISAHRAGNGGRRRNRSTHRDPPAEVAG